MTSRGAPFRTRLEPRPDAGLRASSPKKEIRLENFVCQIESPFDNTIAFLFCIIFVGAYFQPVFVKSRALPLKPPSRNRRVKEISLASMARPQQVRSTPPGQSPGSPSDKENLEKSARSKRKSQTHTMSSSRNNTKRQRLGDRASNIQGGRRPLSEQQRQTSKHFYDPDQDTAERRRVRKGLRDLTRELNGNTPLPII